MAITPPQYAVIADHLRRRIKSGELAPGDQVPTEREIREEFGVSQPVARQAVAQLRAEGLVVSQQGRGSFVRGGAELVRYTGTRYSRDQKPNRLEEKDGGWQADVSAEFRQVQASPEVADRLHIPHGDMVSEVVYRWRVDGETVQVSTQWEPLSLTRGTPIEKPSSGLVDEPDVIARFDSIGLPVDEVRERIRSRMPTPDEVHEMRVPVGVPVFEIERTHYSRVPVETAIIILRCDRFVIDNTQVVPVK
ncbi:GntR family transcriptional regulator [Planomonospora sp. ID82291]|uniref:GntR family transcriptional regulator n=1 Tax=Planomonospora sp. ID82291 TaxID=2738136 RepID=UPI0018C38508|nr:GntR family transcriptional regulator [Planomonospora sp. ID82291]MBG0814653.1 GntR family transcriptional regulator [Planomonospora sp. ID82291]